MFTHPLTDSAYLRLVDEGDADPIHEAVQRNRERLAVWMPWAAHQQIEGTREFVQASRRQWSANAGFQAVIVQHGAIVGVTGYGRVDWSNRSASIGYWIDAGAEGQGLVTRAVRALITHAFTVWELHRLEIRAATENLRSQAVSQRLGLTREGVLRQAEKIGDRYVDHVVFSVLAPEWDGQRGAG